MRDFTRKRLRIQDLPRFYAGRRVFVTGHTGFKGSWLCEWLLMMGAEVTGFSLESKTNPSLFRQLGLEGRTRHHIGDIRDKEALSAAFEACNPDVVFHLAAQPLVRQSYVDPAETHEVNFMGTVRVLELLRGKNRPCSAVIVTTDKCYENTGVRHGYPEDARLGGYDPYSASKACAELAVSSYRRSFFDGESAKPGPVRISSARAGNVIGGGDWAQDRIVPDCIRNLVAGNPVPVRNRHAVRPWQHVLEPLGGYLLLGAWLHRDTEDVPLFPYRDFNAFNFGPNSSSARPVEDLVEETLRHWPGRWINHSPTFAPHEAALLMLDIGKAGRLIDWHPCWDFKQTVKHTVDWYRTVHHEGEALARDMCRAQIEQYIRDTHSKPGETLSEVTALSS